MKLLYNFGIFLYGFIIRIAALFNPKAKLFIQGRKNVWQQLARINTDHVVWFHAASLGEFEQGKPVMEKLKQDHPEINLLVSFFSPSGYEERKDWPLATTCYLPLDTPANAKRFVELVNPKIAVFIRYEFWANYMDELERKRIPSAVIAAQFNHTQFAFKPLGMFLRKRIARLSSIMVQYESAQQFLLKHNFDRRKIFVCGDSRFDRVIQTVKSTPRIPEIEVFKGSSPLLILGSCYKHEIAFVAEAVTKFTDWKFVYAPHWVDDKYVSELEMRIPEKCIRFSALKARNNERILILNTIGKLAAAYRYADIAVVGGGFRDGIHNIIEPAAFGIPVFYGPNHHNFPEGKAMIDAGFGFEINNQNKAILHDLMADTRQREAVAAKSKGFVHKHTGATNCIAQQLESML
jgi:3-deoxy-D-manno-octulosonic-acid transferase